MSTATGSSDRTHLRARRFETFPPTGDDPEALGRFHGCRDLHFRIHLYKKMYGSSPFTLMEFIYL